MRIIYCLVAFCFLLISMGSSAQVTVPAGDKNISYMGRVAVAKDSACFYWPGSSATISFTGTGVSATIRSLREEGYFYAIADGDVSRAVKLGTDSIKKKVTLVAGLPYCRHTLLLYKLSNNTSENILYNFELAGNGQLIKPARLPRRRIEFYGNSITAGHGVDVKEGDKDSGKPQFYNNYYTYAALVARHYNAQYSCIARGGIGIMVSWFPEIMPEVYDRLDPFDTAGKWDFKRYTPDVVVINLFQNDSWLVNKPDHEQFKARFGAVKPTEEQIIAAYKNFVSLIRARYSKAHIICVLGNMDATKPGSKWPGYIENAVAGMKDDKIHFHFFPYKNTPGHPNKKEQQAMADDLVRFINEKVKW